MCREMKTDNNYMQCNSECVVRHQHLHTYFLIFLLAPFNRLSTLVRTFLAAAGRTVTSFVWTRVIPSRNSPGTYNRI